MAVARALVAPRAPPVDRESKARELAALGLTPTSATAYLDHLEARAALEQDVEAWEEHRPAIEVFARCQWQSAVGAAGLVFLGIAAQEIQTVATALGYGLDADLLDNVHTMAEAAATILNKRK